MSLLLLLTVPFIGSAVAALLPTNARNLESLWAAAVALAVANLDGHRRAAPCRA